MTLKFALGTRSNVTSHPLLKLCSCEAWARYGSKGENICSGQRWFNLVWYDLDPWPWKPLNDTANSLNKVTLRVKYEQYWTMGLYDIWFKWIITLILDLESWFNVTAHPSPTDICMWSMIQTGPRVKKCALEI